MYYSPHARLTLDRLSSLRTWVSGDRQRELDEELAAANEKADRRRARNLAKSEEGKDAAFVDATDGSDIQVTTPVVVNFTSGSTNSAAGRRATMTENFEDINGEDPKDLLAKLHQIKLTYEGSDIVKWIRRLEIKMESYGVASQWSKRIVLEENLPPKVQDDIIFFDKAKAEASATIYKDAKALLLKIHGPKPDADYKKFQTLEMSDTPSLTAKRLRDLICKQKKQLTTCCCSVALESRWHETLPGPVRTAVAGMSLKTAFDSTVQHADDVYAAMKVGMTGSKVAALSNDGGGGMSADDSDQVAGVKFNKKAGGSSASRGRGNGQRGKGRGGKARPPPPNPNDKSTWGTPHEDGPPPDACMNHHRHGKSAYYCRSKATCSWRAFENPPNDD